MTNMNIKNLDILKKDIETYLDNIKDLPFTQSQKDAILSTENVIESAGAGCGKTSVLTEKICQFIRVGIFNIDEVIIMTFTNNATNEMKARIKKRLNELALEETNKDYKENLNKAILQINSANVSTIDSLCKKIVNKNFEKLTDIPMNSRIADETELKVFMYQVFDEVIEKNINNEDYSVFFKSFFNKSEENIKDNLLYEGLKFIYNFAWPEEFFEKKYNYTLLEEQYNNILKECYEGYENKKKEKGVVSISDLSHLALRVLYKNKGKDKNDKYSDVCKDLQNDIKYLFVDEYQDTSEVQEKLIKAINGNFDKVKTFLVGDIKQSIYRFRNSRVKFFKEKVDDDIRKGLGYSIKLIKTNDNFRSDPHIINFVNDFFGKVMNKNSCGLDYKKDHALVIPDSKNVNNEKNKVEINILHNYVESKDKKENNISASKSLEAEFIAKRIKEFIKENNNYSYNDIVILHKSPASIVKDFEKAFKKYGIPLTYEKKSGFYDSYEIRLLMAFLNIIDNPMQDIYLTSVINTGIFNVSLDELAIINSLKNRDDSYYSYIKKLLWAYNFDKQKQLDDLKNNKNSDIDESKIEEFENNVINIKNKYIETYDKIYNDKNYDNLIKKLDYFINVLNKLIEKSRYKSASDIVEEIFDEVDFIEYVCGLDNHETGKENLLYFLEIARNVNKTQYRDVYNFNIYLDSLVKKKADLGEAEIASDIPKVRIVSIHKSKGMQYPIVILPYLSSQLSISKHNNYDKDVYFTYDKGLSLNDIDIDNRLVSITDKRKEIVNEERREILEECLRLLYVATTRACDKLICSITSRSASFDFSDEDNIEFTERKLYANLIYFDEGESLMTTFGKLITEYLNTIKDFNSEDASSNLYADRIYTNNDIVLKIASAKSISEFLKENNVVIDDYLNVNTTDEYFTDDKYIVSNDVKPKYSVSEIKLSHNEDFDFNFYNKLKDMNSDNDKEAKNVLSGSELGTAYHNFMSLYNFNGNINDTFDKIHNSELIDDKNLFITKISKFLDTDIAKEMFKAYNNNLLFREQRFMKNYDIKEVYEKMGRDDLDKIKNEKVIVQGVIDCFFIDDKGEIVLIDYKTDFLNRSISDEKVKEELVNMYEVQLNLYAESLAEITGKKVGKIYIYSFKIDDFIEIIV